MLGAGAVVPVTGRADPQRSQRKTRDRSMVLVLIGTVLLMPPIARIFLIDGTLGGIPVPLLYVFAVWSLLIAGTAWLSRALRHDNVSVPAEDDGEH